MGFDDEAPKQGTPHPKRRRDWMPKAWADRVAFVLMVLAAYLTLLSLLAGFAGWLSPFRTWFRLMSAWLLVPPVLLDLASAYMTAAHLLGRTRTHGQAVLSWLYYVPYCLFGLELVWWWRPAVLAGLTLFHACCHYYVPLYAATRLGWRPREGEFPYWPWRGRAEQETHDCQPPEQPL